MTVKVDSSVAPPTMTVVGMAVTCGEGELTGTTGGVPSVGGGPDVEEALPINVESSGRTIVLVAR